MKKKHLIVPFLLASLVLPCTFQAFTLHADAEDKTYDTSLDVIDFDSSYIKDEETGYISLPSDYDPYPEDEIVTQTYATEQSTLPSMYHCYSEVASLYPGTRNQNPYGTCWAFATVACAEFDLITEGTFPNSGVTNLSEYQLIYNMYHTGNDLFGNLSGDTVASYGDYMEVGGNIQFAQHILASWKGLTHEDNIPYPSKNNSYDLSVPSNVSTWNNMVHLENSRILNINSNPSAVKKAIMEHGAVYASYKHDSTYYNWNNGYALYYCPTSQTVNHSIAIVGWNDNLSASLWSGCNYQPSGNGAWLIRNSWSTTTGGSEYSYFWMSYEDKSLLATVYDLDFATGDNIRVSSYNYDSIYQYDGTPTHSGVSFNKIANIFTARNYYADSKGSQSETLEAIMIPFSYETNVNLKIDIYTGLTNLSNPQSGQHHTEATTYYTTDYKGLYTIRLKNPVLLAPGETYSIVVTQTSGKCYYDVESSQSFSGWFYTTATAHKGESFYSTNGSTWTDISQSSSYGNICLKGLTKNSNTKKYTITYKLNGGKKTSSFPSGYASTSSSFKLPTPKKSGYHFLGWYTDSKMTKKITSVSGSTAKNLTLYAKWGKHTLKKQVAKATPSKDGVIKNKCTSCDYVDSTSKISRPKTVTLSYTSTKYSGNAKKPTVTIKTANGKTLSSSNYTVTYKDNINIGTATVTIKFKGNYSGTVTKHFKITKKPFTKVTLSYSSTTYSGKAKKPSVTVYSGANSKKVSSQYYTVTYKNNVNVGTATVTIEGKGKYAKYRSKKTFKITPKAFTKVTLSNTSYVYTGKAKQPSVTVYVGNKKISSKNYTVTYKNNTNIGTGTVTIKGKNNYSNYKTTKSIKILPKKQAILSLETRGNAGYFYCIHTYDSTVDSYYVQVSDTKSFKKIITSLQMSKDHIGWYSYNLKSKKTYYVRVRSLKTVNGKTYYGSWSPVKSIKTL